MKRKIGDKYLVVTTGDLSREKNMFIELNETSSFIWDCIDRGCNENETALKLCAEFGISREKALADVNKTVEAMKNAGVFDE